MFGEILSFLLNIVFTLFGTALIARAWIHAVRLHPFNPLSRTIYQATDWLIVPIRKLVPTGGTIDWPSLVATWLVALIYMVLLWVLNFSALLPLSLLPGMLLAALINVPKWALNLIVWLTLIQAVLSWVNPMAPMMPLLKTLTAPLLDPVRRLLPRTAIDFSPMVVLIAAQIALMMLTSLSLNLAGI